MTFNKNNIVIVTYPTTARAEDITGRQYHRLSVLGFAGRDEWYVARWWCECACGQITKVAASALRSGSTKSCGCWLKDDARQRHLTHGRRHDPIYAVWSGMKGRCLNPRVERFPRYGGRGIMVCKRWMDFAAFLLDVGEIPFEGASIDRIGNDGHYSCGKCQECLENGWDANYKWSDTIEQANNKSTNRRITIDGDEKTLIQWVRHFRINRTTFYRRVKRGWSEEDALSIPVKYSRQRHTIS